MFIQFSFSCLSLAAKRSTPKQYCSLFWSPANQLSSRVCQASAISLRPSLYYCTAIQNQARDVLSGYESSHQSETSLCVSVVMPADRLGDLCEGWASPSQQRSTDDSAFRRQGTTGNRAVQVAWMEMWAEADPLFYKAPVRGTLTLSSFAARDLSFEATTM